MALGNPGDVVTFSDTVNTQAGVVIQNTGSANLVAYHFMGYPDKDHQKAAKEYLTTSVTVASHESN
jgi:hypothetical protein